MDMLETIKFILGDNNDYTDLFLSTILDQTISEIEIYIVIVLQIRNWNQLLFVQL